MNLHKAEISDLPALARLINGAYRGDNSKKGWTTEADLLDGTRTDEDNLASLINDPNGLILEYLNEKGELIGCVNLQRQNEKTYLGMLTVAPELQGGGVGKQLLQAAIDFARGNSSKSIYMTVISLRHELIAWYERHGYHKTGEKKPFPAGAPFGIQKQPLELIVLEKTL